ncbi:Phage protein [Desulfovibrio sp. DV]|uniref:gp16 family protein n=1 Tax=Desulfovibrio sp. DV TaxID=1844708 RepID=UPI00094BBA37|nr:regulatory protein GemA [Desulfovibrio sp. DV]OLN30426.1 Phage protein [Desulfovibrio sp. DV]
MRPESRKSLLAKIHIAKKDLGLDDDTYRAILERLADQDSAAALTVPQLVEVVAYLRKLGWQGPPAKKPSHRKPVIAGAAGYIDKIEALLAEAKRSWSYAGGIAKRMYGAEKLEWLKPEQVRAIMVVLMRDANRHGRPA